MKWDMDLVRKILFAIEDNEDIFRACAVDAAVRAWFRSWRGGGSGGPSPRAADPLAAEARPARSARGPFRIASAPCPRHP